MPYMVWKMHFPMNDRYKRRLYRWKIAFIKGIFVLINIRHESDVRQMFENGMVYKLCHMNLFCLEE